MTCSRSFFDQNTIRVFFSSKSLVVSKKSSTFAGEKQQHQIKHAEMQLFKRIRIMMLVAVCCGAMVAVKGSWLRVKGSWLWVKG